MIIFGKQCFEYTLHHAPQQIKEIYITKDFHKKLFIQIRQLQIPIVRIDNKKAQGLARGKNHQGILAKIADIALTPLSILLESKALVVLCGLHDIGNIGSIIRTSFALGVDGVILCDRNNLLPQVYEGIFRASSGALLRMPFGFCSSSLDIINQMKMQHFSLFGAGVYDKCKPQVTMRQFYEDIHNKNKWALFIGKEDIGLSRKILNKMDTILHITMSNNFDSLNASVATGILLDRIQNTNMA